MTMTEQACGCISRRGFLGALGAAAITGRARADTPFRVDVHHHIYPPGYIAASARHTRMIPLMTDWTPQHSLEQMDLAGIRTSMLSITTPGLWWGDAAESRQIARLSNEYAAGMMRDHPGRFGSYAAVPLPDIEGSLREIEYALDTLKADGIGVFTNYGDTNMGDPVFAPVYAELNRRKAILYTHPTSVACCANLVPGVYETVIEYGTATARSIATMVFHGFDLEYPDIKVIFSHAGGTMPSLIERFEVQATQGPYPRQMPQGVHPAIRHFNYDTAQASNPQALGALMGLVPASQILFGTDYPYRTCVEHVKNLAAMNLAAPDLQAIERDNAVRLTPRLG